MYRIGKEEIDAVARARVADPEERSEDAVDVLRRAVQDSSLSTALALRVVRMAREFDASRMAWPEAARRASISSAEL